MVDPVHRMGSESLGPWQLHVPIVWSLLLTTKRLCLVPLGATPYELDISTFDPGNYTLVIMATSADGATAQTAVIFTIAPPGKLSYIYLLNTNKDCNIQEQYLRWSEYVTDCPVEVWWNHVVICAVTIPLLSWQLLWIKQQRPPPGMKID